MSQLSFAGPSTALLTVNIQPVIAGVSGGPISLLSKDKEQHPIELGEQQPYRGQIGCLGAAFGSRSNAPS